MEVYVVRYVIQTLILPVSLLLAISDPGMLTGQALSGGPENYVIAGGRLWVGTVDDVIANPGIVIRNGTIIQVGNLGEDY